jgi:hypothetical protein
VQFLLSEAIQLDQYFRWPVQKNIKANVPGLEFITQLRPVTYTLDINGLDQAVKSANFETVGAEGLNTNVQPTPEEVKAKEDKAKVVYTDL